MVSGIILTGVIGGSKIANYIGKHFINRCLKDNDDKNANPKPWIFVYTQMTLQQLP